MSRGPAPADPVEAVMAALARRLPGRAGRSRDSLLREAYDGLRDAAEAYERQGGTPTEAARRAAEEFGDPAVLAPSYADDVLRSEARRTSTVLALGYLLVLTAWAALGSVTEHAAEPRDHAWAGSSFGLLGVLAAVVAAGVVLTLRVRARTGRVGGPVAWVAGVAGLLCGGATLVASYLVEPWGSRDSSQALVSPWTLPVEVLSGSVVAVILGLSVRCLVTAWRLGRPERG